MSFGSFPIGGAPIGGQVGSPDEFAPTVGAGILINVAARYMTFVIPSREMIFYVPIRGGGWNVDATAGTGALAVSAFAVGDLGVGG